MLNFGWALPLDHGNMPNFDKYASKLVTNPSWDPGNIYTMAWQSGYTLIAYNTKYMKEDITSVEALWDPKYKGKIGMFGNASELGCIGLLAIGKDPATSTPRRLDGGGGEAGGAEAAGPSVLRPGVHQGPEVGGHLDLDGLVGRHLPGRASRDTTR